MAIETDVDVCICDRQIRQPDPVDRLGEASTRDGDAAPWRVDVHTKRRREQQEHRAGRPGLRRTCNRIERGVFATTSRETTNQLGQTMEIDGFAQIAIPAAMIALSCGQIEPL
jgi:hypothetical protein